MEKIKLTCGCGAFDHQFQLTNLSDGTDDWGYSLEVVTGQNNSLWYRIQKAMRYIFKGGDLYNFDICLSKKELKKFNKNIDKMLNK